MIDLTDNRLRASLRRWGRWVAVAIAAVSTLGPTDALAEEDAGATAEQTPTLEVQFEDLGVIKQQGRLVVDYTIAEEDWDRLDDARVTTWVQLRIPNDVSYPDRWFSYTLSLEERSGRREFPRWLTTDRADDVGVCLLGTGPGDNLVYGRGYTCRDAVWVAVERNRPDEATRAHTFELTYLAGPPFIPYAPWVHPRVPNFQGPFDQLPAP